MKTIEMNKTFTISLILSNLGIHKREKGQGKKLIYVKRKRCVCALERERKRGNRRTMPSIEKENINPNEKIILLPKVFQNN